MNQPVFRRTLAIHNPFDAPVYHEGTVGSTMELSRELARQGEAHGTVIVADFQQAGRGRICKRLWDMERGAGLPFTILLRYPRIEEIPEALTLRTGLAVSLAIEDFAPALAGRVKIKWPNDIMISSHKAAGILTEADGGNVHIGIGVNVAQKRFPDHLKDKATSIYIAIMGGASSCGGDAAGEIADEGRFALLERILVRLYNEIMPADNGSLNDSWKSRIDARLYKKGELVNFADSAADSGKIVSGILAGIGQDGELQIFVSGELRSFIVGELLFDEYLRSG